MYIQASHDLYLFSPVPLKPKLKIVLVRIRLYHTKTVLNLVLIPRVCLGLGCAWTVLIAIPCNLWQTLFCICYQTSRHLATSSVRKCPLIHGSSICSNDTPRTIGCMRCPLLQRIHSITLSTSWLTNQERASFALCLNIWGCGVFDPNNPGLLALLKCCSLVIPVQLLLFFFKKPKSWI